MVRPILRAVGVVSAISLWHWLSTALGLQIYLSTPAAVALYMAENAIQLARDLAVTLGEAAIGFSLAVAAGLAVTYLGFTVPGSRNGLLSALSGLQVIPLIVFAPLLVAAFGYGLASKVAMAFIFVLVSFTIAGLAAYGSILASYHDLVRSLSLLPAKAASSVYLPLALPSLFAAMKVCAGLAVLGAVIAEFTGAQYGLGKNIFVSTTRLEPELMWASIFLTGIAGAVLIAAVRLAERHLGHWYL
jgi:ABC-type nitrate/sulfonate/bicarbonate transport system permease component